MKFFAILLSLVCAQSFAQTGVVVDVTLNPVGSFKATTSAVKGSVVKVGDGFRAENITVNLKDLKTGIGLRDEHMKNKYLQVDKYPEAVLVSAKGSGGKGTGTLKLHGVEKEISGTYEVKGNQIVAHFPIKISDYKMDEVNYKGVGVEDEVQAHITLPIASESPAKGAAPQAEKAKKTK